MIIDAHSHVHDPIKSHIGLLDDAGVDRTVLFPTRPHPERATDVESLRREFAVLDQALAGRHDPDRDAERYRAAWQEFDEARAAYPDRFIGFGSVPLDLPDDAIAEAVQREIVGRGLRGIGELTPRPGAAERLRPVLRAADDHGALPVVVHGFAPTTDDDLRTLARLAAEYPRVPLVISQLGGLNWMTTIELAKDRPNIYVELSTAYTILAVKLAINELPTRTIFGSDAPYGDPVVARTTVERVTRPGEVRDRVLGGTFEELLNRRG
jgi:uncharacterized protein